MWEVQAEVKAALVIDERDNVAVALTDLRKGDVCTVRKGGEVEKLVVSEDIPFGHKLAIQEIGKDESVYKYGEEIGRMSEPIGKGGWIHSHNMYCERGMERG